MHYKRHINIYDFASSDLRRCLKEIDTLCSVAAEVIKRLEWAKHNAADACRKTAEGIRDSISPSLARHVIKNGYESALPKDLEDASNALRDFEEYTQKIVDPDVAPLEAANAWARIEESAADRLREIDKALSRLR